MYYIKYLLKIIYNFIGDFMNFDLRRLNSNIDSSVPIDINYEFSSDDMKGTDLISCKCSIKGEIVKSLTGELAIDLIIDGIMILPCSITLKPVEYPFNIEINGEINEILDNFDKNYTNTIDIFPIIWENILMEIPMRVVSDEGKDFEIEGDGWSFKREEEHSSPFDELKNLFE